MTRVLRDRSNTTPVSTPTKATRHTPFTPEAGSSRKRAVAEMLADAQDEPSPPSSAMGLEAGPEAGPEAGSSSVSSSPAGLLTPSRTPRKKGVPTPTRHRGFTPSPATPPSTPTRHQGSVPAIYAEAKTLFQRGFLDDSQKPHLTGRETEAKELTQFLANTVATNTSLTLYILGPPGTGKTAQLHHTLAHLRSGAAPEEIAVGATPVRVVLLNCMIVRSPELVFQEIIRKVFPNSVGHARLTLGNLLKHLQQGIPRGDAQCGKSGATQSARATLSTSTVSSTSSASSTSSTSSASSSTSPSSSYSHLLLVLDEMDSLLTKDQQVLFELFLLVQHAASFSTNLMIVGIANALDFTDKFLPRLRRNGLNPHKLAFLPYTWTQIRDVVTAKLATLDNPRFFHPMAVQLCCKKASAVTGDLRKALDICYQAVDAVEREWMAQATPFAVPEVRPVLISHMAKVCALAFGVSTASKLELLNMLQKLVLCVLSRFALGSVHEFYSFYRGIVADYGENLVATLKRSEFLEVVAALESQAVVLLAAPVKKAKMETLAELGNRVIKLNVGHDDLVKAVAGMGALQKLLKQG